MAGLARLPQPSCLEPWLSSYSRQIRGLDSGPRFPGPLKRHRIHMLCFASTFKQQLSELSRLELILSNLQTLENHSLLLSSIFLLKLFLIKKLPIKTLVKITPCHVECCQKREQKTEFSCSHKTLKKGHLLHFGKLFSETMSGGHFVLFILTSTYFTALSIGLNFTLWISGWILAVFNIPTHHAIIICPYDHMTYCMPIWHMPILHMPICPYDIYPYNICQSGHMNIWHIVCPYDHMTYYMPIWQSSCIVSFNEYKIYKFSD